MPGPGTYDVEVKLVNPATAASLTPRRLMVKTGSALPGPGAYSPAMNRAISPAYSIARSPKADTIRSQTPSPAAYSPSPLLNISPSYGIGAGKRDAIKQVNDSPGPGTYTPKAQLDSPQFSMKLKLQTEGKKEDRPGPGHYSPSSSQILTRAKTPVIGNEPKLPTTVETHQPPPGAYNIPRALAGPRYSFGRSQRSQPRQDTSPGPGQYTLPPAVANVPAYLLKQ